MICPPEGLPSQAPAAAMYCSSSRLLGFPHLLHVPAVVFIIPHERHRNPLSSIPTDTVDILKPKSRELLRPPDHTPPPQQSTEAGTSACCLQSHSQQFLAP